MLKPFSVRTIKRLALLTVVATLVFYISQLLRPFSAGISEKQSIPTTRLNPSSVKETANYKSDSSGRDSEEVFADLTFDFRKALLSSADSSTKFDVLEAMKKDGYQPIAVSVIVNRTLNCPGKQVPCAKEEDDEHDCLVELDKNSKSRRDVEQETLVVPNVVHFIYFPESVDGSNTGVSLTFLQYLSFKSVSRFIKPKQIFVHGNEIPTGHWWNITIHEVRNIYHVKMPVRKTAANGERLKWIQHSANIVRLEMMLRYGGIYLDRDILVLKSFDPLRKYPTVLGAELPKRLNNGVIIARRGSAFLRIMLEQYHSYAGKKEIRLAKGVENPKILAGIFPHLVHVEESSLHPTSADQVKRIYNGNFDWTENYSMHLFVKTWPKSKRPSRVEDILTINTTIGEMARHILFCSSKIRQ